MTNQLVATSKGDSIAEALKGIQMTSPGLYLLFYGADIKVDEITSKMKETGVPFMGCMDAGRLCDNQYFLDTQSVTLMALSKELFDAMDFSVVDMGSSIDRQLIMEQSAINLKKSAEKIGIDLNNPDMEGEFAINLLFGLDSANAFLEGQARAGMMLQSVGGSSGGKTDFVSTHVTSHIKSGNVGIMGLFKLKAEYAFIMDRVSSFESLAGKVLEVDELAGPRHILKFNDELAANEYSKAIGIESDQLGPDIFANYTLGIDPGDGEILVTSIMAADVKGTGFLTYNDVRKGTQFNIYKSIGQKMDRKKILEKIKTKNVMAYISFDCILCYLARNSLNQVQDIANLYGEVLPSVPKIGFGTFSENICGANINQTETFIAIYKK